LTGGVELFTLLVQIQIGEIIMGKEDSKWQRSGSVEEAQHHHDADADKAERRLDDDRERAAMLLHQLNTVQNIAKDLAQVAKDLKKVGPSNPQLTSARIKLAIVWQLVDKACRELGVNVEEPDKNYPSS
jgi:uncharacterized membrane-anchored protein YhcB (DUF1043 family)